MVLFRKKNCTEDKYVLIIIRICSNEFNCVSDAQVRVYTG